MTREKLGVPNRPKRVPLHEQRNTLTITNKDPNFEYRIVNDVDNRISKFKLAGWEAAPKEDHEVGDPKVDTGQATTTSIVEKAVGGRVKAILMRIPKEWYDEDQAKKAEEVDRSEAAMKREAAEKADYGNLDISKRRKVV
jgi:hypothetical protein